MSNKKKDKFKVPTLSYVGTPRLICDILDEMRTCFNTHNFSFLMSLVEECQIVANRMESALEMQKSITTMHQEVHDLKQLRKELLKEVEKLNDSVV